MDERTWAFAASVRAFLDEVVDEVRDARLDPGPTLTDRLAAHLGVPPHTLPLVTELVPAHRAADADIALELLAAREPGSEVLGITGSNARHHNDLGELLQADRHGQQYALGAPDYATVATGPDTDRQVLSFALVLLRFGGDPVAVLTRGANPQYGRERASLEVLAPTAAVSAALLAELRELMTTHSVLRGKVLSFQGSDYAQHLGGITFHHRPTVAADDVVLPDGVLTRVRRHVLGIGDHRQALRRAGQHLKRGVLLYGPPGTGKTHTVRHLVGAAADVTVILLAGQTLAYVSAAADTARALAPAIVVLEDCDLVAEDRMFHGGPHPLLFEVLDALDGLAADSDVTFLLTTNRVEVLESALAQRPGRVDLAVEIPLPDAAARRRLFRLYAGDLPLSGTALDETADRCEATTASFAKELVRRAVLTAAERDRPVSDADLAAAADGLLADQEGLARALFGGDGTDPAPAAPAVPGLAFRPARGAIRYYGRR